MLQLWPTCSNGDQLLKNKRNAANPNLGLYLIKATLVDNLEILTSGTMPPNSSELLNSQRMQGLISSTTWSSWTCHRCGLVQTPRYWLATSMAWFWWSSRGRHKRRPWSGRQLYWNGARITGCNVNIRQKTEDSYWQDNDTQRFKRPMGSHSWELTGLFSLLNFLHQLPSLANHALAEVTNSLPRDVESFRNLLLTITAGY